jgi:hypothetical protein
MSSARSFADIEPMAVEQLGGPAGVVEFARATARIALEEHGPASDEAAAAVNRVLREHAEATR